jgi:hypothetical protein
MSTWPNRGASGGPCAGLMKECSKTKNRASGINKQKMSNSH